MEERLVRMVESKLFNQSINHVPNGVYEQHTLECESITWQLNTCRKLLICCTRLRFFSSKPATRTIMFAQSSSICWELWGTPYFLIIQSTQYVAVYHVHPGCHWWIAFIPSTLGSNDQYPEGTLNMSNISLLLHGASTTNILTLLASSDILSIWQLILSWYF